MGSRRRALRLVITAGPTREPLDPVRFLSNYSTGTMGTCVAAEARRRGHRVTLISGPISAPLPRGIRIIWAERATQMQQALAQEAKGADGVIMAAAVCDFRPRRVRLRKLSRRGRLQLELVATPDLIGGLPRVPGQVRVGFAVETARAVTRARDKLRAKHLDLIVGQVLNGAGGPFGDRPVEAFFLRASGSVRRFGVVPKAALARALLDEIEQLWYGGAEGRQSPGAV